MKSTLYMLMISLLVLAGCNNQSLESTEQSVSKTHQVKINLGDDFSSRSNRYKGNYNDVLNGGSVKLRYSFEGPDGQETRIVGMDNNGSDWTISLTLAIGNYTFSAEARNSSGAVIFDTPNPVSHTIVPGTTDLALGLRLEPIMEAGADSIPMPTITQITKPAGYWPGGKLGISFQAQGGSSDELYFEAKAYDVNEDRVAKAGDNSSMFTSTDDGSLAVYDGTIWLDIPDDTEGQIFVELEVTSDALQMGSAAAFIVQGAVNLPDAGGVVFLMPFASEFGVMVTEDNPDNLTIYLALTGNDDYADNLTFVYDDTALGTESLTKFHREMDEDGIREKVYAELDRDPTEAGEVVLTFTHMNDSSVSYTQSFPIGAGTTSFGDNTSLMSPPKVNAINDELLSQNRESGVMLMGQLDPGGSYSGSNPSVEVADGSVWFFEPASGHTGVVQIDLAHVDGTVTRSLLVSTDQGNEVYLPTGDYYMALTSADGVDYRISVHYQPTNVVDGSPLRQSPVEVSDTWDYQEVKTYPIYLSGKKDWRLKFLEANNNQYLNFCIRYAGGIIGCASEDNTGSRSGMHLDSTESDIPAGWYELEVAALEPDDGANYPYNSSWAIYEIEAGATSGSYGNSIETPDGFEYALIPGEQFWLDGVGNSPQTHTLQLNCSQLPDLDLWIYTSNVITATLGSANSNSSGWKITSDDCQNYTGSTTITLTPDSSSKIHFGLQLLPTPWSGIVQLGTSSYDSGYDIVVNENGDVYVAGWSHGSLVDGTGGSAQDLAVLKYDSSGNRLWARQLEDPDSTPYGIAIDASSNVYLAGETDNTSNSSDPNDLILLKYDGENGSLEWNQKLGTNQKDIGEDVTVDSSGNIYVIGTTAGSFNALNGALSNAGARDFFVAKYDDTGILQWIQQLGTSTDDIGEGVAADYHGNIYVVGWTKGSFNDGDADGLTDLQDVFVAKYDSATGAMEWIQQLEGEGQDFATDIALDSNGHIYVTGLNYETNPNVVADSGDLFIAKLDSTGQVLWNQQLEDAGSNENPKRSAIDPAGNILVTGFNSSDLSSSDSHAYAGGQEAFVVKYDNTGALQWVSQFGTGSNEQAWGIAADIKGDIYVTGNTSGALGGTFEGIMDLFVVKFSSDGVLQ